MKWMTIRNLKKNSRYIFVKNQENEKECYLIDLDVFFWGYFSIFYHKKYPHQAMKIEERAVLHLLDEETGKFKMKIFDINSVLILLMSIYTERIVNQLELVTTRFSLLLIVLVIITLSVVIKVCFSWLSKRKLFKQTGILYVPEEKVFFELEWNAIFVQIFTSGTLLISYFRLTSSPGTIYNYHGYGLIFLILGLGLLLYVNRGSIPPREGQMDFADEHGQKKKMVYWDEIEEEPVFKRNERLKEQPEVSEKLYDKGLETEEKE